MACVVKRGARWAVKVYTGEGRQKWISGFRSESEARRYAASVAVGAGKGLYWSPVTLEAWVSGSPRLRYVLEEIGRLQLHAVSPQAVERALQRVPTEAGRARAWAELRRAFERARRMGIVATNPVEATERPRPARKPLPTWTDEEVARFLEATYRHPKGLVFRFALLTGMRQGEVLGLTWRCVDLDRGLVHVEADLERLPGGEWRLGAVKTPRSRRTVALPQPLVRDLRRWKAEQAEQRLLAGPRWQDHGLVFTGPLGQPLWPQHLTTRDLPAICADAGVPVVRFHDLRHAHVTLLVRRGVPVRVVADRVGHSRAGFTLDRYSWAGASDQAVAVAALEASSTP